MSDTYLNPGMSRVVITSKAPFKPRLILSQAALQHCQRALTQWPADTLRPELSFARVMQGRLNGVLGKGGAQNETSKTSSFQPDSVSGMEQANALYSLLENRYTRRVRESRKMR